MSGLSTSLSIAVQALNAQQGALQGTTNNIANVNTAGYSRQVPELVEAASPQGSTLDAGGGVTLAGFQSIRDQVLELQIQEQTQQQSSANTQSDAAQLIEPLFESSSGQDIGSQMSAYFNSLSALSASPSDSTLRQGVLIAGQNLANSFQTTSAGLTQVQANMNQAVPQDVAQINQLTQQIASLNGQISAQPSDGALQDQLNNLTLKLSGLIDVSTIQTEHGVTLTTGNGTVLVAGEQSFALTTTTGSDGMQHVMAQGQDITSSISGGSLGGELQMRDQTIPGLLGQLDTLASTLATSVNAVSTSGYDLNGNAGQDFFTLPSTAAWSSGSVASASTSLSAGSFTLQPVSGTATTIQVGGSSGIDTLSDLADYINNNSSSLGVTASVATDSSGAHLTIAGSNGGCFTITSDSTNLGLYTSGAAAQMGVAITDVSQIAASSDGSAGSNGNLTPWMALQNNLYSGQNPTTAYSTLVANVGFASANAQAEADASSQMLQQLNDQRSSISGVSIDEETTNMLRYQQAYEAAARVVTTINQLTEVLLNMDTGNGSY